MKDKTKHWTSGSDKVWVDGKYVLRPYARMLRLLFLYKELKDLKLPTLFPAYELLRVYRRVSVGVDVGRYKFEDCAELFSRIEEFFQAKNVDNLLRMIVDYGWVLDDGLREFLVKVGFLEWDVTEAVTREMVNKLGCRESKLWVKKKKKG